MAPVTMVDSGFRLTAPQSETLNAAAPTPLPSPSGSSNIERGAERMITRELKTEILNAIQRMHWVVSNLNRAVMLVAQHYGISQSTAHMFLRQRSAGLQGVQKKMKIMKEPVKSTSRRKELSRKEIVQLITMAKRDATSPSGVSFGELSKMFGISMTRAYEIYEMRHSISENDKEEDELHKTPTFHRETEGAQKLEAKEDDKMDGMELRPPTPVPPATLLMMLSPISERPCCSNVEKAEEGRQLNAYAMSDWSKRQPCTEYKRHQVSTEKLLGQLHISC